MYLGHNSNYDRKARRRTSGTHTLLQLRRPESHLASKCFSSSPGFCKSELPRRGACKGVFLLHSERKGRSLPLLGGPD